MSLAEIDTPQETDLRDNMRRAEENRRRLQDAGFKTCTHNGMLCDHAKGVEFSEGEAMVKCNKWKKLVTRTETERCLNVPLIPVVAV